MREPSIDEYRYFLKDTICQKVDFGQTDQQRGVAPPPLEKPFPADAQRFELPPVGRWEGLGTIDLTTAIAQRQQPAQLQAGAAYAQRTVVLGLGHAGRARAV